VLTSCDGPGIRCASSRLRVLMRISYGVAAMKRSVIEGIGAGRQAIVHHDY